MLFSHKKDFIQQTPYSNRSWLAITVVLIPFFLFLLNPSRYYFTNDDFHIIPKAAAGNFLHPLTPRLMADLTLWFDHFIWNKNAFGYHLANAMFHFGNVIMVYYVANQLFYRYSRESESILKSRMAAFLFLIYAFHSEPIFSITARGGSLSTLFFLFALFYYLKRHASARHLVFSLLFFFIGLFTYESIWIFPLICVFISFTDVFLKKRTGRSEWIYPFLVCLCFLLYLFCRFSLINNLGGDYQLGEILGFNFYRLFYNYNTLLARLLLPPMKNGTAFLLSYIVVIIAIITGFALIKVRKRKDTLLWLLLICFLIAPIPVISLGIDTHDSESERFIYLPSFFIVLLIVEIFSLLMNNKKLFRCFILLMLVHGYYLFQAASAYRYSGSIVKRSLEFINKKNAVSTIYAIHLPTQYQGGLMFRGGFEEALKWVCSDCRYEHITTVSSYEFMQKKDSFQLQELTGEQGIQWMQGKMLPESFIAGKDMVLYWTDGSLTKIR